MMGGRIGVDERAGPRQHVLVHGRPARRAWPTPAAPPRDLAGLRVLVVDDNATNREILERRLASWRMQCETAQDGDEGLERIRAARAAAAAPYDSSCSTITCPGWTASASPRELTGDGPRVILLSSAGTPRRAPGVTATLSKPVRESRLYDAIATAMVDGAAGRRPSRPRRRRPAGGGASILLAEDNPTNQAVAVNILRRRGYRVDVAAHGGEAVDALRREAFDAVLMDCQMPVLDGYAATAEIRRLEGEARRTPIIAMTAHAMEGDRERCIAAGMDDYLSKPLHADDLDAVLQRWVAVARAPVMDRTDPRRPRAQRGRRGDRREGLRALPGRDRAARGDDASGAAPG